MKTLSDWVLLQEEEDRGQQQLQQQGHVVFHVLSVLLAAQYSCCSKGLLLLGAAAADSSSAGYNAICNPQVRAAMQQGVQLLISALDIDHHHHHHHIDGHHIAAAAAAAPHPLMHFNKDTDGRRLVGLCSLMLQVCTVCYVLSVDDS